MITPALESFYLDITGEQHRVPIRRLRESAVSLGAVVGPLLIPFSSRWLAPYVVFTVALPTAIATVILALVVLKLQGSSEACRAGRDTSERAAFVVSKLGSMVEESQTMRQPILILADAKNTIKCDGEPIVHRY